MVLNQSDRLTLPPTEIVRNLVVIVKIESIHLHNPVKVSQIPQPWQLLGTGNYAGVLTHPDYENVVIKVYAPTLSGWAEEVEVYRRLGKHQSFSQCFYAEPNWLMLQRLQGATLYDSMYLGLKIPKQVIEDIDLALEYAKSKGLTPHDVHGRNVMMFEGKGFVVDISDFLDSSPCWAWNDLKKAYYWLYQPLFSWHRLSVPYWLLDRVRSSYRLYRKVSSSIARNV